MKLPWIVAATCSLAVQELFAAKTLLRKTTPRGAWKESREPLAAAKHMWASGFDAKSDAPFEAAQSDWISWTDDAVVIFEQWWRSVQFPPGGCQAGAKKNGFIEARIDMDWGVTSVMRDVVDQLLYGLLTDRFVVFSTFVEQHARVAMADYRTCSAGNHPWLEQCFFKTLVGCTDDYLGGLLGIGEQVERRVPKITEDTVWFLQRTDPLWEVLLKEKAVKLHHHAEGKLHIQQQHAERLAMLRSLMLHVAFQPNDRLEQAIAQVQHRAGLSTLNGPGPRLAVHIRRTDKINDFTKDDQQSGVSKRIYQNETSQGLVKSLSTVSNILLPWIDHATSPISAVFLMSDDWRMFQPLLTNELRKNLKNTSAQVVFDPSSAKFTPRDVTLLNQGHEAWGHRAETSLQVLAESYAAARWADYIVGCGSSGVTQLIAQLMSGVAHMDPNSLGLWEDDRDEVTDLGTQVLAAW